MKVSDCDDIQLTKYQGNYQWKVHSKMTDGQHYCQRQNDKSINISQQLKQIESHQKPE